jgi:hypothetical protein
MYIVYFPRNPFLLRFAKNTHLIALCHTQLAEQLDASTH